MMQSSHAKWAGDAQTSRPWHQEGTLMQEQSKRHEERTTTPGIYRRGGGYVVRVKTARAAR
ncbi:MAG: hypothetical protein QOJ13_1946 [Gaiellales bacterium]|jgi:hypothetical protein|nr:hypothetical protein [Gaiellales bacterium]